MQRKTIRRVAIQAIAACALLAILLQVASPALLAQGPRLQLRAGHGIPPSHVSVATSACTSMDFDADGDPDLLVGYPAASLVPELLLNDGSGSFALATTQDFPARPATSVAAGDFDADGDIDVLTPIQLLLNDGRGRFTVSTRSLPPIQASSVSSSVAGDVDADGDLDVVFVAGQVLAGGYEVWINDGKAGFTKQGTIPKPFIAVNSFQLVDLDGDKDLDIFELGATRPRILIQNAKLAWRDETSTRWTASTIGAGRRPADVNGDGHLDLLTEHAAGMPLRVHWNNGSGNFLTSTALVGTRGMASRILLQDLDLDGDLDLVMEGLFGGITAFEQTSTLRFRDETSAFFGTGTRSSGMHFVDVDQDGDPEIYLGAGGLGRQPHRILFNTSRQLFAAKEARLGQPWALEVYYRGARQPSSQAVLYISSQRLARPQRVSPFGTLAIPPLGSTALLPIALTSVVGSVNVAVPSNNALKDLTIYAQGVILPDTKRRNARLTNLWITTIR